MIRYVLHAMYSDDLLWRSGRRAYVRLKVANLGPLPSSYLAAGVWGLGVVSYDGTVPIAPLVLLQVPGTCTGIGL